MTAHTESNDNPKKCERMSEAGEQKIKKVPHGVRMALYFIFLL
jgi:hypothetical protein